jgi:hypothetical protein
MSTSTAKILAAYAIQHGARQPSMYEKVINYVFHLKKNFSAAPADVGGIGAVFYAAGATEPYWLEWIGNQVLTYPNNRETLTLL